MMERSSLIPLFACLLLAGGIGRSSSAELRSVKEVGGAIATCWHPPAGSKGSTVTLRLGFRRDGSLLGKPRASAIDIAGDPKIRKAYIDAAMEAVSDCTPLAFSPDLATGKGNGRAGFRPVLRRGRLD